MPAAALTNTSEDRRPAPRSVTACISIERSAIAIVTRANASTGDARHTCAAMSKSARFTVRRSSEI
jgi:hypothetical protein